eukprot:5016081-Pleurochrysis_carterae.AAC.6
MTQAPCCYMKFGSSGSIQDDFARHAELISNDAAGMLARIWLNTTLPILPVGAGTSLLRAG